MKKDKSMKNNIKLSFNEEVANAVTHGVMATILLLILPITSIYGYTKGGFALGITYGIFITSLLLMFLGSTLYHAMGYDTQHKYVFRILDHIFIYFAIAGTYTPICVYLIGGKLGYGVLIIQWLMVLFGVLYKAIGQNAAPKLSVAIYLTMGWAAVIVLPTLFRVASPTFVALIAGGGLLYSIGAYFYMQDKPYYHTIWHLFINAAAICHFIAIVFFI